MEIEQEKINILFGNVKIKNEKNVVDILKSNILVKTYLKDFKEDKILKAFKMVNLDTNTLNKNISKLSTSESFKISLIVKLLKNDDTIYINNFDKYFNYKDQDYFKKLFIKLSHRYHKTFIFTNVTFEFAIKLADIIIVVEEDGVHKYSKNEFYDIKGYSCNLIDLVKYINKDSKKIDYVLEIDELIKTIYREV